MEDGPKLLPQWLRNSNSALHHRGDAADASKRGRPAATDVPRQPAPADPWLARPAGGSANNGVSAASAAKPVTEFSRGLERTGGAQDSRPWKQRDSGYSATGSRSGYGPGALRPGGRDPRDPVSLKPGGGYGSGRAYGRSGDSEGGSAPPSAHGVGGGRLDRVQDSWPPARTVSGAGRGGDDERRSPLRAGPANGGDTSAVPSKATFEKDFPSLRPAPASTGSPGPATPAATAAAPLATSLSSPLLDPVTDPASSSCLAAPYRQTFLSARTTSNWTSALAEAPPAPPPVATQTTVPVSAPPAAAAAAAEEAATAAAAAPAASASPVKPAPAPAAPAPVVPPRPAGVWGAAAAAVVGAGGEAGAGSAPGVSVLTRSRSEQHSARQAKQMVPLGKAKAAAGSGAGVGAQKPTAARREDAAAPPAGPVALSASSTVVLSKKASQPLDRPVSTLRAASATSASGPPPPAAAAVVTPASPFTPSLCSGDLATCGDANALPPGPAAAEAAARQEQQLQQERERPSSSHPALVESAEEEAFLRSLGWTACDEEDDMGLTEEEIAAFRAEQQQHEMHSGGGAGAAAAVGRSVSGVSGGGAISAGVVGTAASKPVPCAGAAACRRAKPLIVAVSYGSEQISSSDSDSECY